MLCHGAVLPRVQGLASPFSSFQVVSAHSSNMLMSIQMASLPFVLSFTSSGLLTEAGEGAFYCPGQECHHCTVSFSQVTPEECHLELTAYKTWNCWPLFLKTTCPVNILYTVPPIAADSNLPRMLGYAEAVKDLVKGRVSNVLLLSLCQS